jgi:hypothetical protein
VLAEWLAALEGTAVASGLRNSVWAYPLVNTGHLFGIALLVGGSVPLSLRLLGAWKSVPLGPVQRLLSRSADLGFLLAVVCGFMLFSTRAAAYARSGLFLSKMLLLIVAVASTLVLRHLAPPPGDQHSARTLPRQTRAVAGLSLAAWLAVLTLGRLIGYF